MMHCDKHVVKMILETAQLLWCAHHKLRQEGWHTSVPDNIKVYRKTHENHPMAVWVRKDARNYKWTARLGLALCKEYTKRYHKIHKCESYLEWLISNDPFQHTEVNSTDDIINQKKRKVWVKSAVPNLTDIPLCMDEEYYVKEKGVYDAVKSYRNYYCKGKAEIATWKFTPKPEWWEDEPKKKKIKL